jgi:hypothetical protein
VNRVQRKVDWSVRWKCRFTRVHMEDVGYVRILVPVETVGSNMGWIG